MNSMQTAKGVAPRLSGKPSNDLEVLDKPSHVACLPEKIPFVKPRLKIRSGDRVKIGSCLFEDKRRPDLKFLSPASGEIVEIDYGPRRVIRKVVIRPDGDELFETFDTLGEKLIETATKGDLAKAMMAGGVWPMIKSLPFRDIADPEAPPPMIIVSLGTSEPFHPRPEVYLQNETDTFRFGLKILGKFADRIVVAAGPDFPAGNGFKGIVTHSCAGGYPATDPGAVLYHIKTSPEENRAWYVDGQDVLGIARFFRSGKYPIDRIMAVSGSHAFRRMHFKTRIGVPARDLAGGFETDEDEGTRLIAGGVFNGYTLPKDGHMGFYENGLIIMNEGDREEAFGFMRPGYEKPSFSRTFLSHFNTSEMPFDCGLHGEERACVNCGYCARVCPVDILPQFTMKCVLADEVEEALAHGLLDCAECGLCTYVCPSKIELGLAFKRAKASYYKEMA